MAYQVNLSPKARRELSRLASPAHQRIQPAIDALAQEPRPSGVVKLAGFQNRYRVRIGDYRIVYEIHDTALTVLIIGAGHRREICRS